MKISTLILALVTVLLLLSIGHSLGFYFTVFKISEWIFIGTITILFWLFYDTSFENSKLKAKVKELEKQLAETLKE